MSMKVFGLAGYSGSGKTTLMVQLLPLIVDQGLSVSTIKHAHHDFDVDQPGKDSYEHRSAGATEVMVSSARRWALMHEHRAQSEADLDDLLRQMTPVDLVLVEGFKRDRHDKLEIVRGDDATPNLCKTDPHVVALASDRAWPEVHCPVLSLDDPRAIAAFVLRHCDLPCSIVSPA
jgi:molybdopterin-guanine dinucleotide biosynthesis adapter protein